MKCLKCGTDFEGNFCPNCAAPAPGNPAAKQATVKSKYKYDVSGTHQKKQPLKAWQIVVIVLSIFVGIGVISSALSDDHSDLSTFMHVTTGKNSSAVNRRAQRDEEAADKLLAEISDATENANFSKALDKVAKIKDSYPETKAAASVDTALAEAIAALPHVSAENVAADFSANEVKADDTYTGKLFVITGTIASIGKDITDTPYVTLDDGVKYSLTQPQFMFKSKDEIAKVAELYEGDTVSIIGVGSGSVVGKAIFKDCYLG